MTKPKLPKGRDWKAFPPRDPALRLSLFERLADDSPDEDDEDPFDCSISLETHCERIRHDLSRLLNTVNNDDLIDAALYPHAARSFLNYGVPAMAGRPAAGLEWDWLQKRIRRAVGDFERRLLPDTLELVPMRPNASPGAHTDSQLMRFELRAQLAGLDEPTLFLAQGSFDLQTGHLAAVDGFAGQLHR